MDFYLTTSASTFPCFQINWMIMQSTTLHLCDGGGGGVYANFPKGNAELISERVIIL